MIRLRPELGDRDHEGLDQKAFGVLERTGGVQQDNYPPDPYCSSRPLCGLANDQQPWIGATMRHKARIAKAESLLQALQPAGKAYLVIEPEDWSRLDELEIPPGVSWIFQRGCSPDDWDEIEP